MNRTAEYVELERPKLGKSSWSDVVLDGERFRPFPEVSILDFDGRPYEFSQWFAQMLYAGEPFAIRDFHRRDEWRGEVLCLNNLIEQLGEATPLRQYHGQRSQAFHLRSLLHEPQQTSSSSKSKNYQPGLYARDIKCPSSWLEVLDQLLPADLKCRGAVDLFRYLPKEAYAESMMVYAGSRHSHSGFHRCFDGTTSFNLLLETKGSGNESPHSVCLGTNQESQVLFDRFIESNGASPYSDWTLMVLDQLQSVNFPIYFRKQLVGDLVVFPGATAHQICNSATFSVKLVWNILNVEALGSFLNYVQPIYKKLCQPDQGRISLVPYHAVASLFVRDPATGPSCAPAQMEFLLNALIRIVDEEHFTSEDSTSIVRKLDPTSGVIIECNYCGSSIFNRHLNCDECENFDLCISCFIQGRSCQHVSRYHWVEFYERHKLLYLINTASTSTPSIKAGTLASMGFRSPATIANEALSKRRVESVRLCHLCRDSHAEWKGLVCTQCSAFFCYRGLFRHFDVEPLDILASTKPWICQKCEKLCNCRCCSFENPIQSRNKPPTRRVGPVDPRGRVSGFSDNVFDRRKTKAPRATASSRRSSPSKLSSVKKPRISSHTPSDGKTDLSQLLHTEIPPAHGSAPVAGEKSQESRSLVLEDPSSTDYKPAESNTSRCNYSATEPVRKASSNLDIVSLEQKICTLRTYIADVEVLALSTTRSKLEEHLKSLEDQLKAAKEHKIHNLLDGLRRDFPDVESTAVDEVQNLGLSARS